MKFNQSKYSQLIFFKSIKRYFNNIKKYIYLEQEKNLKNFTFGKRKKHVITVFNSL